MGFSPELYAEKLETLSGDRPRNKRQAAVRRQDFGFKLPTLKSSQLDAAPTMDDYNKLQADIAALLVVLTTINSLSSV